MWSNPSWWHTEDVLPCILSCKPLSKILFYFCQSENKWIHSKATGKIDDRWAILSLPSSLSSLPLQSYAVTSGQGLVFPWNVPFYGKFLKSIWKSETETGSNPWDLKFTLPLSGFFSVLLPDKWLMDTLRQIDHWSPTHSDLNTNSHFGTSKIMLILLI